MRDFLILARAVEIGTTCIVNDCIRFQSRVKDPSGKLNKKHIQLTEDEFAFRLTQLGALCILALIRSGLIYPLESRSK